MQKARRDKRISYRPSSGSYSLGAGYSGASRLEKTGLRAVLLEKEFKDDDGDVEYLYDQQDGAWGGPSRHVTIREEGDPEKSLQDLDSVRVIPPNEECTHCADDTGRVETASVYARSSSIGIETASIYSLDLPTIMSDQNEFALYPRFGKLNCLNLLHLQQHLFDLEQQLEDLNLEELTSMEAEDFMDNTRDVLEEPGATGVRRRQQSRVSGASYNSNFSVRSAGYGGSSAQEKADREQEGCKSQGHILRIPRAMEGQTKDLPISLRRCKLMGEVEMTLGAYNRALLSYSQLLNLPTASTRDRQALKNWLERADDPLARNSDSLRFLDEGSADVIALCARDSDILENFFQSRLLRILENWSIWAFVFPSIREAVATIRPTIQSRATLEFLRFLISLGGAVMIVAPVVVLYFTRSEWGRLMIICVCTIIFAIMMHMFTDSDKKEVLMATTGYTAVLVVFVGSDAFSDETVPMPG